MENIVIYLVILASLAVVMNGIAAFFDYMVKDEIAAILHDIANGGRPQNIAITEKQAEGIAKIVKKFMEEKEED